MFQESGDRIIEKMTTNRYFCIYHSFDFRMTNNLVDNRHIRFFISSTFQDMQDERDRLIKYTFPRLKKMAADRDVTLTELDLRWGITKEESQSGQVVEICFREIENSIPFFIGIIGNRYGWVPKHSDINEKVTDRFPCVNTFLDQHLSVTEMEMQFGVLLREENMHAFFFVKEQVGPEIDNPQMLTRLMKKVKASRYPTSIYKSIDDLAQQVEEAFVHLLDNLYPVGDPSEREKESIRQRSYLNQLCKNYVCKEEDFKALDKWLYEEDNPRLVVTGPSGLGKSALLANWINSKYNEKDNAYNIVYHFIGKGGGESGYEFVSQALGDSIASLYQLETEREPELDNLFLRLGISAKPLLIVIDAINQIAEVNDSKLLNWLPAPPENVKYLISTLEEDPTFDALLNLSATIYRVKPLNQPQRAALVTSYLGSFAKKLTSAQVERIITDPQCENTLVLKTLLHELVNFGVYEKLDERIDSFLSKDSIPGFFQTVLESHENDFPDAFDKSYVRSVLLSISLTKHGLKEDEIIDIANSDEPDDVPERLRFRPLNWSQLSCALEMHLCRRNGLIGFSHVFLNQAVKARYLEDDCDSTTEWYSRNFIIDRLVLNGPDDFRSCDEIAFQKYRIGLLSFSPGFWETEYDNPALMDLYDYLTDPAVFFLLYKNAPYDLATYWSKLAFREEASIHSIYTFVGLFDNLDSIDSHDENSFDQALCLTCFCRDYLDDYLAATTYGLILVSIAERSGNIEKLTKAFHELALCHINSGAKSQGMNYLKKAYDLVETSGAQINSNLRFSIFLLLGDITPLSLEDNPYRYYCKAEAVAEEEKGENSIDMALLEESYGKRLAESKGWTRALEHYWKALTIKVNLFGDRSKYVADTYVLIGDVSAHLLSNDSLVYYGKALAIYKKLLGNCHTKCTDTMLRMASVNLDLDNNQEAISLLETVLDLLEGKEGLLHQMKIARTYELIGHANFKMKDYQTALQNYELSYNVKSENGNKIEDESKAQSLFYIGRVRLLLGEYASGLRFIEDSVSLMEAKYDNRTIPIERESLSYHYSRVIDFLKSIDNEVHLPEIASVIQFYTEKYINLDARNQLSGRNGNYSGRDLAIFFGQDSETKGD